MKRAHGFTIVELLIVIVVIAILAAISVAAYSNISNRANDSAVQSDLASFAKQLKLIQVDKGAYPKGGGTQLASGGATSGAGTIFPGVKFSPSKESYAVPSSGFHINLVYCEGPALSDGSSSFRLTSISDSGNGFTYSPVSGTTELGKVVATDINVSASGCDGIGWPRSWSYGYYRSSTTAGEWKEWTS